MWVVIGKHAINRKLLVWIEGFYVHLMNTDEK